MNVYYNGKPHPFEIINFMTLEQQAQVIKLIEEVEATEKLTIPRVLMTIDDNSCLIRSKNDEQYYILRLGTAPYKAFAEYMRAERKMLIGEPTADNVIKTIGSLVPLPQEMTYSVKGRSMESGLPAALEVSSIEVREVLLSKSFGENFVEGLRFYLKQLPRIHNISHEQLAQAQIILREGLHNIRGFSDWLEQLTGLKTIIE